MPNKPSENQPEIDFESISILVPKTREGDVDARDQLLHQVHGYLNLMAAKHMDKSLQQKVGPSDVVQQTLTQVIQNFDDFRGETAAEFRGWLKAIVVNEMNKLRRTYRAHKRDISREQSMQRPGSPRSTSASPADANLTPSSEAMAAEQIEHFYQILALLSEDYATVIRLRSLQGLPFKEIADQMERSHDSVTKLWYRAVLKFEELLREHGDFISTSQ